MGREIAYCGVCGVRAEGTGAQGGMLADRRYCPECLPREGPYDPRLLPEARLVAPRSVPRARESTKRTHRRRPGLLVGVAASMALALAAAAWAMSGERKETASLIPVASQRKEPVAEPKRNESATLNPDAPERKETATLNHCAEEDARALYGEYEEAALGLADEGRFDGALKKIDAFPEPLRATRAGRDLEALRRSLLIRKEMRR